MRKLPLEETEEAKRLSKIPQYIKDIVFIHNFRFNLHSAEEKKLFDWYVEYVSHKRIK